jgi:Undecaprenyl-phosphate glucose phosphotransferase
MAQQGRGGVLSITNRTPGRRTKPKLSSLRAFAIPHAALPLLFALGDGVLIIFTALLADFAYHALFRPLGGDLQRALGIGLLCAALFLAAMHWQNAYRSIRSLRIREHSRMALLTWLLAFGGLAGLIFLFRMGDLISRGMLLSFFLLGLGCLLLWRIEIKRLHRKMVLAGTVAGPRVIVLSDRGRADLHGQLQRIARYGYSVARLFVLPAIAEKDAPETSEKISTTLDALIDHVRSERIDEIVVVTSWQHMTSAGGAHVLAALRMVPTQVKLIAEPELQRIMAYQQCHIGAARALILKPAALTIVQRAAKRTADILAASLLLVLLSPLLLAAASAIKATSKGPVFFRQWRGGYNGQRFRIFKLRTMHVQQEGASVKQATRDDPRVTPIGRFLRRASIDELPQLLNVLCGDMSLVGPRPHAIAHDESYAQLIAPYQARFNMKPGLTGWAQVNGCRGETATVKAMEQRVNYDLDYIDRWSMLLDLRILFMTLREFKGSPNAY